MAVDPDGGSTDGRATGSGVVLRLRGAAEALPPPGFSALPLLLVVGAIAGGLASRGAEGWGTVCGGSYAGESRRRGRTACDGGPLQHTLGISFRAWGLYNASGRAVGVVCCRT